MILMILYFTHFLHSVTAQSLIAWMEVSTQTIVQTKMKAVTSMKAMVGKILSSAIVVKPAYRMVTIFLIYIHTNETTPEIFQF